MVAGLLAETIEAVIGFSAVPFPLIVLLLLALVLCLERTPRFFEGDGVCVLKT